MPERLGRRAVVIGAGMAGMPAARVLADHFDKVIVVENYIAGDRDLVVGFPGMNLLIPNLKIFVPQLSQTIMLPGCGHWTQQERAPEVNKAMIEFLRRLP